MYSFAGKSIIEKGEFSKQIFENNNNEFMDEFDLYTLYVLEDEKEVELVVVRDIVNYVNDDEFGTRYAINFAEQMVSEERLEVSDAKGYLNAIVYLRKEEGIIKLH